MSMVYQYQSQLQYYRKQYCFMHRSDWLQLIVIDLHVDGNWMLQQLADEAREGKPATILDKLL